MAATTPEIVPTDAELVADILAGVDLAFDRLHYLYAPRISRFVASRLREKSDVDDTVQDVLIEVHRSIGSFEGRSSLLVWMFGIARRVIFNRFRRWRPVTLPLEACDGRWEAGPDSRTEMRLDARRALETCAQALERDASPSQREIFDLYYGETERTRVIAAKLGNSDAAVKASLHRTRRKLERRLVAAGRQ